MIINLDEGGIVESRQQKRSLKVPSFNTTLNVHHKRIECKRLAHYHCILLVFEKH